MIKTALKALGIALVVCGGLIVVSLMVAGMVAGIVILLFDAWGENWAVSLGVTAAFSLGIGCILLSATEN